MTTTKSHWPKATTMQEVEMRRGWRYFVFFCNSVGGRYTNKCTQVVNSISAIPLSITFVCIVFHVFLFHCYISFSVYWLIPCPEYLLYWERRVKRSTRAVEYGAKWSYGYGTTASEFASALVVFGSDDGADVCVLCSYLCLCASGCPCAFLEDKFSIFLSFLFNISYVSYVASYEYQVEKCPHKIPEIFSTTLFF